MTKVQISRTVEIPDQLRISRYQKNPELGPRILFFSGGSAINGLSRVLKNYTHNSIHLVTPYDSGGSSAKLRQAFAMPAIGDLRSRLMALADETVLGAPEIYQLFNYRLPNKNSKALETELEELAKGKHPLINDIANPMRSLICNQLGFFVKNMPDDFNLNGASIGNLILAGGYLNNHQHLDPIIFLFSKLVNVHGTVKAIVNDDLHLSATLQDGSRVIGQHLITGKEAAPLQLPITDLSLSSSLNDYLPATSQLRKKNRKLIAQAELICFPMGSLYSSVIANLLPQGVSKAIAQNDSPKVFIPNLGDDPEQVNMSLEDTIKTLIDYLQRDHAEKCPVSKLLNFIVLDSKNGQYPGGIPTAVLDSLGIKVIDLDLIDQQNTRRYDDNKLVAALLSLT